MKIAYFDCFAGVSGDMIVGSLLDSGLKFKDLKAALGSLNIKGLKLSSKEVMRQGLRGTQFIVETKDAETFKNLRAIEKRINKSRLNSEIKEKALKIFNLIAASEAKVHKVNKQQIHFHEIGACDTIVDVVGALWGLHHLGIKKIYTSPLPLGSGFVSTLHGRIPVPAPATCEILKKYPVYSPPHQCIGDGGLSGELTTPTGAAILSVLSSGCEMPFSWKIERIGYGAGSRDSKIPNLLRLFIGRQEQIIIQDEVTVLETNIDNMDPQAYELIMERLFKAGALDAFLTDITMKKGRPAQKLTVLSQKDKLDTVTRTIFKNTPTLGVRTYQVKREKLPRRIKSFKTPWGTIKIKEIREVDGGILRLPEADDVMRLARAKSMSYQKIYKKILDIIN